tara:strand:+ start:7736 stop:8668 length:933 start_codon:yes stop_codon:yes gene_type:complete
LIGVLLVLVGIIILYFSGEWLVGGSTSLAKHLKIQPFIIALTLVAFGTSAPELAISINAALKGHQGITLGNIIGSNIANILFVIPIAFFLKIPKKSDLINFDCAFLIIITVIYAILLKNLRGFNSYVGFVMLFTLFAYIFLIIRQTKRGYRKYDNTADDLQHYSFKKALLYSLLGIVGIALGSEVLVTGAIETATSFKIDQTVIGLSMVALGTSIPEVATSLVAAYRGQGNIILGAILGSNLFNILGISGVASSIAFIKTQGIISNLDIIFLLVATFLFISISYFIKALNKFILALLLSFYVIYILILYF